MPFLPPNHQRQSTEDFGQNAFGGRALPGPAGGAIALPRPSSRYKREEVRGRKGLGIGRRRIGEGVIGERGYGEGSTGIFVQGPRNC